MDGAVMYAPGDVRVEERSDPEIVEATDATIRVSAACVCGSDLWPYRGVEEMEWPAPMGHEYAGVVEEVGSEVETIVPGQFVVGSFWASDNTCELCRAGYQSACVNRVPMGMLGAQAEFLRIPLADGTLVATPDLPDDDLIPSLLSASDVLGTGWFGAVAAHVGPGKTVAVVGDGAVGVLPSLEMVIWVAVGGRGTLAGAVLGAVSVNLGRSVLTNYFPELWPFILGGLFVVVVLLFPDGLIGIMRQAKERIAQVKAKATALPEEELG